MHTRYEKRAPTQCSRFRLVMRRGGRPLDGAVATKEHQAELAMLHHGMVDRKVMRMRGMRLVKGWMGMACRSFSETGIAALDLTVGKVLVVGLGCLSKCARIALRQHQAFGMADLALMKTHRGGLFLAHHLAKGSGSMMGGLVSISRLGASQARVRVGGSAEKRPNGLAGSGLDTVGK
ncbi:hypothetical protein PMIN01_04332 [Paraphaeosphaeria minitans]|uniref:Uncharacterized protein n=1 Tax=Paraphaeosphaeria minitans TaxID=565426 RepID=A0A9P6KR71_9PLEO|nr:hypothetical protein PMIN01_04332 [Paraphaeosphaeria minitans]